MHVLGMRFSHKQHDSINKHQRHFGVFAYVCLKHDFPSLFKIAVLQCIIENTAVSCLHQLPSFFEAGGPQPNESEVMQRIKWNSLTDRKWKQCFCLVPHTECHAIDPHHHCCTIWGNVNWRKLFSSAWHFSPCLSWQARQPSVQRGHNFDFGYLVEFNLKGAGGPWKILWWAWNNSQSYTMKKMVP